MRGSTIAASLAFPVAVAALALACGSSQKKTPKNIASPENEEQPAGGFSKDDHARCEWKGHPDREVSESTAAGAFQPNIRRVYKVVGTGIDRRKVMICREVDTNLDGVKDVMRTFNDNGEAEREEADTNYDGHVDTWTFYAEGHIIKQQFDTNHDGKPDVWKFFMHGKLSRVQRDRNHDGKPDVWENYIRGRLDRIGIDVDYDGRVDRWDRDEMAHAMKKTSEEQSESSSKSKDAGASETSSDAATADSDGGAS